MCPNMFYNLTLMLCGCLLVLMPQVGVQVTQGLKKTVFFVCAGARRVVCDVELTGEFPPRVDTGGNCGFVANVTNGPANVLFLITFPIIGAKERSCLI
ncbi:hypothetical protein D3C75_1010960 [compost metagenome]